LTIGGKGLGIFRMGLEHPVSIKSEEMMEQKNNETNLSRCIGYTSQVDKERLLGGKVFNYQFLIVWVTLLFRVLPTLG
jgi:hypothetical protein